MVSSSVGTTQADTALPSALMRGPCLQVGFAVQLHAEPLGIPADPGANLRLVLADPGREDDGIEPAERCRERAELAPCAVTEHVHGEARRCHVAREQVAHVAREA